ncbi:sce7726 family protein [Brucella intermedia]|uniref:sce7726 family protein n=1 Tax=Brucella intermedia TaxID=94625 RepID=UPI00224B65E5|nr:sce7726 family protein [Brucella intermedia]
MRDVDVRQAILNRLSDHYANDRDTRVVEEMGIWSGVVRIDVAVINGELSGYELKSDSDTLDRLSTQAFYYEKVFEKLILVVGSRHIEKARNVLPKWWGIIEARSSGRGIELKDRRKPRKNPRQEAFVLAQLLWKEEALAILDRWGLAKGWKSKSAREINQRLASELPIIQLNEEVRTMLKIRGGWLRDSISNQRNMPIQ